MYKIKLIVAGGRDFTDKDLAFKWLDFLLQNYEPHEVCIVCGKAKGADTLGDLYHKERGTGIKYFKPDWKDLETPPVLIKENKYGKYNALAGTTRNHQMGDFSTHTLAFWDQVSTGTKDMIDYSKKIGLTLKVVHY